MKLKTVEINPNSPAKASIIWLHGLGADGHDFEPIVGELKLPEELGVRFIFPHAPIRPVTINNGMSMRAWFDIFEIKLGAAEDETGIIESAAMVAELIEHEHQRGIEYKNIILAGFSQGGAVALYLGLSFPQKLAGVMALSAFLPVARTFPQIQNSANQSTPIFLAHGSYDPVIPLFLGEGTKQLLQEFNYAIEWHTYLMAHTVCGEEIVDIAKWIRHLWI